MAAHFEEVGGVPCIAVDVNGRQLFSTVEPQPKEAREHVTPGCTFCRMVRLRNQVMPCEPSAVHRYGVFQAERFGGSFVFFCPANLAYWASPVAVDGKTVGALIAGSVMMIDPDDYLSEEVRVPLALDDRERVILKEQFGKIPYVPPSRVTSLARVLADMAFSLSQKMESHSWWDHPVESQQARISEYIHQLKKESEAGRRLGYPIAKEKELLAGVARGDQETANRLLNEILASTIYASGNNPALIKSRVVELEVLISRAVLEAGAHVEEVLDLSNTFLVKIQDTVSIEEMAVCLTGTLKRFSDCIFPQKSLRHVDLIQKAVRYLNANYAKDIDLQIVADHLHISPSHFSKVFKEEVGQSFVHYLNQIRVDRSKQLLRDRSISLVEISDSVGFEDQSYFTKVFRKITGITPGCYRNNRGLPPETNLELHE